MSPILGIYASQISGHLFAPSGAYDSIATTTVGAGGAASITFSSIPSTYTHLQLRFIARGTSDLARVAIRINNDNTSNYSLHYLFGSGTSAGNGGTGGASMLDLTTIPTSTDTANAFGAAVVDILDYTNTNKIKPIRSLGGSEMNTSGGYSIMYSGIWNATPAINRIDIIPGSVGGGNIAQYSQFALYGIKGA